MSKEIASFPLKTGIFSLCSVKWDETQKDFTELNDTDIIKCCLGNCDFIQSECKKICNGNLDCEKSCRSNKQNCVNNCKLNGNWEQNDPFIICANKKGCINSGQTNKKCIQTNKKDLIDCCRNNCTPSDIRDCQTHCEFSYELNKNNDYNESSIDRNTVYPLKYRTYPDNTLKYVTIGIVTAIILAVVIILISIR